MTTYPIEKFLNDLQQFDNQLYENVVNFLNQFPANNLNEFLWSLSHQNAVTLTTSLHKIFHQDQKYYEYLPIHCYYNMYEQSGFDWFIDYLLKSKLTFTEQYSLYWTLIYCLHTNNNLNTVQNKNSLSKIYFNILQQNKSHIKFPETKELNAQKRIFIYTTSYLNDSHAPTRIANKWAECFTKLGYTVFIVICTPSFYPYPTSPHFGQYRLLDIGSSIQKDSNTYITEIGADITYHGLYQDYCTSLNFSDNDRYILIGDSCLHFDVLPFKHKYIVALNSSYIYSSAKNLIFHDNLNLYNIDNELMDFIQGPFDYTDMPIMFSPPVLHQNDPINIAIISNRLDHECTETTWNTIRSLIQQIPKIKIFLVGTIHELILPADIKPYIECVGYQSELVNFYQTIHFYLKLEGNGGGQSAVLALKCGIPVITLPQGDVYSILHQKYCIQHANEIATFVLSYITDLEFRSHINAINKSLVETMNTNAILLSIAKQIIE